MHRDARSYEDAPSDLRDVTSWCFRRSAATLATAADISNASVRSRNLITLQVVTRIREAQPVIDRDPRAFATSGMRRNPLLQRIPLVSEVPEPRDVARDLGIQSLAD